MSAFLQRAAAQRTGSVTSTSLWSSPTAFAEHSEAAKHRARAVVAPGASRPSVSSKHPILGSVLCEESCHQAKPSSGMPVHLFCPVSCQRESKSLCADATPQFPLPCTSFASSFLRECPKKKKRAMITTRPGWCEKGAHQDPKTLQLHTVCPSSKSTNCVFSGKRNIMRICKLSGRSR